MTYFTSGTVAQMMAGQNSLFAQNNYMAQQMAASSGGMQGGMPQMAPPPPMAMPPPPPLFGGGRGAAMYGERAAGGMNSFAQNVAGPAVMGGASLFGAAGSMGMLGGGAMGMAGRAVGAFDPMGAMMSAGRMGYGAMGGGAMGMAGGMMAAGAVAAPMYAGAKMAQAYGGAFTGGIQDQMGLNQNLRQNFNFAGGSQGRGFSQQQMGTVGGIVQQELNRNVFSSAGEMNQLIAGGSQAGMFNGVRDVSAFATKFRQMLDTLKAVQTELGGTLTEALQFVNESRQAGIFQQMDRSQFATQIRNVTQVTGMSRQDAMSMAVQGASIARQAGGIGSQGAMGATRVATSMGTALNSGIISQQMLSEATGGQTGSAAIQSFTSNMMQRTGRFLRRPGMGRFSLYAMAGQDGNLDEGMMQRFLAGDITTSGVSRAAHRNVRSMGRAEALNRAGEIRGSIMERGGMAGQIGMMRLMLGDRATQGGDHLSSLVMQRRFGMSRSESDVMQTLMRNQGQIAQDEGIERRIGRRSASREQEIAQHGSMDAVQRRIGGSLREGLGLNAVRQSGRRLVTGISQQVQNVMDDMLGVVRDEMTRGSATALERASLGRATQADLRRLRMVEEIGGQAGGGGRARGAFEQGALEQFMGRRSPGEQLESAGFDITGLGIGRQGRALREQSGMTMADSARYAQARGRYESARSGVVHGAAARGQLATMLQDRQGTTNRILDARLIARGREGGVAADFGADLAREGTDPTATLAFMARTGMAMPGEGMRPDGVGSVGAAARMGRNLLRGGAYMAAGALTGGSGVAGLSRIEGMAFEGDPGVNRRDQALEHFMRGGVTRLRSHEIETTGNKAISGKRGGGTGEQLSRIMARGRGAELASREVLEAVFAGSQMQDVTMRMMNGGPGAQDALQELSDMAATETDGPRRAALDSLRANAQLEIQRSGRVSPETWGVSIVGERAAQQASQVVQARLGVARGYEGIGRAMSALGGDLNESMGAMMTGAGTAFRGNAELGNETIQATTRGLASGSEELYTSFMGRLSDISSNESGNVNENTRERARAMAGNLARERGFRNALVGRGRRGRRQAIETAESAFGGIGRGLTLTMGEGDRERQISGRRADSMVERFLRGGRGMSQEARESVIASMGTQMQEAGLGEQGQRVEVMRALQGVAGARTSEEREAAADVVTSLRDDPAFRGTFEELNKRQTEQALANAGRRDPMGAERNRLLTQILTAPGVANAPADGVSSSEVESADPA